MIKDYLKYIELNFENKILLIDHAKTNNYRNDSENSDFKSNRFANKDSKSYSNGYNLTNIKQENVSKKSLLNNY